MIRYFVNVGRSGQNAWMRIRYTETKGWLEWWTDPTRQPVGAYHDRHFRLFLERHGSDIREVSGFGIRDTDL